MSGHFRYYLRVRYGECDAQKVVFNARYADYIDLATTELAPTIVLCPISTPGRMTVLDPKWHDS